MSHLFLARGAETAGAWLGCSPLTGEDVVGGAGNGAQVVDGADFGEAFAVAFLALGQPGREFGSGGGGFGRGLRAQRVRAHDDAFAVGRDHQHVGAVDRLGGVVGGVEVFDVDRCRGGERLGLAFAEPLAGAAPDRLTGLVEGPSR